MDAIPQKERNLMTEKNNLSHSISQKKYDI